MGAGYEIRRRSNSQLNQGGGSGNFKGGKFGDLDLSTTQTEYRDVSDGKGGSTIEAFDTALTEGGMRKDIKTGKNIDHLGANTIVGSILDNVLGIDRKTKKEGETFGFFDERTDLTDSYGVPYADLGTFAKMKIKNDRYKEMIAYGKEIQKQKELKEQIEREKIAEVARAAQYGATNYGLGADGQQSYSNMGTQGFGVNATTGGPVSNKTGRGRTDWMEGGRVKSYFKGGLVSLRKAYGSGGSVEKYEDLIDAFEKGIDVIPGETLTQYINRIRAAEKR